MARKSAAVGDYVSVDRDFVIEEIGVMINDLVTALEHEHEIEDKLLETVKNDFSPLCRHLKRVHVGLWALCYYFMTRDEEKKDQAKGELPHKDNVPVGDNIPVNRCFVMEEIDVIVKDVEKGQECGHKIQDKHAEEKVVKEFQSLHRYLKRVHVGLRALCYYLMNRDEEMEQEVAYELDNSEKVMGQKHSGPEEWYVGAAPSKKIHEDKGSTVEDGGTAVENDTDELSQINID